MDLPAMPVPRTRLRRWVAVAGSLLTGLWLTGCPWTPSGPSAGSPFGMDLPADLASRLPPDASQTQVDESTEPEDAASPAPGPWEGDNRKPPAGPDVPYGPAGRDQPADRRAAAAEPAEDLPYRVMSEETWTRVIGPREDSGGRPVWRWQYPNFEDLLARPPESCPNLTIALVSDHPVVAANAAIGLARLGHGSALEQLAETIRNPDLKLPIRRAAAEALATLREPDPTPVLGDLLDQYGDLTAETRSRYLGGLHAELIRGLSWHVDPADDTRFLDALGGRRPILGDSVGTGAVLEDPPSEVKLEALRAWTATSGSPLPEEVVRLRTDGDPKVRAATLSALGNHPNADTLAHLTIGLNDWELEVRAAAIVAMGKVGTPDARAALQNVLAEQPVRLREESVSALAAMGAEPPVLEAASDKSWQVRKAVARALHKFPSRNAALVAGRLLNDPSCEVQREVVAAVAKWPLARAGPIFLAAMRSDVYLTRREAAEQLTRQWKPAAEFALDEPESERNKQLKDLAVRFRTEIGIKGGDPNATETEPMATDSPPWELIGEIQQRLEALTDPDMSESARRRAVAELTETGPELVDLLEYLVLDRKQLLPELVYREVLPGREPTFKMLDRLASRDVVTRRLAAEDLAKSTEKGPLRPLALSRLTSLGMTETDTLVWQGLLSSVASDTREPATRLAYAAIGHSSAEIRRRACEHLASGAEGNHVRVLIPALKDRNSSVVRAAVVALRVSGQPEAVEPLKELLAGSSELLRVEVAVALAQLGDASGPLALERLSYSTDETVRRDVAKAMGRVADPTLAGSLIRLLDDRQTIRRQALKSLPLVVGHDVAELSGGPSLSPTARLTIWKEWHATQPNLLGSRAMEPSRVRETHH